jgi:hydrogenase maturation protein HypF
MGRLFDAVAALIGIRQSVNYEAQAAMEMEALSDDLGAADPYPFSISGEMPHEIDVGPMLAAISSDVVAKVPSSAIISRFHRAVTQIIVDVCVRIHDEEGIREVALSGGVFQNVLLLQHSIGRLEALGLDVLTHRIVPPNDGGLALGQAIIAASHIGTSEATTVLSPRCRS